MYKPTLLYIVIVPVLNIMLNIHAKKTASNASSFIEAITSINFMVTVAIGALSITTMLALYSTGINLARGILFMGAISIIGGSLYGVIVHNNTLTMLEWALLCTIGALLTYRWLA